MNAAWLGLEPIGVIETPFQSCAETPVQPSRAREAVGRVRLNPLFVEGLRDLAGFDRVWLLYWLHRSAPPSMIVTPFLDASPHGLFATRAPARPAPIGLSAVRLLAVRGNLLEVAGVDMLDGTPLLDIKPYVPEFDSYPDCRSGWLETSNSTRQLGDERFQSDAGAASQS
ncbi:MAG: tRNA (N6-threonylcarbamoyladenosine(37)-N6)-methyltransferase TrmO [Bryobacter sp.]|jgi:tRNA-Thr(GGU) m(6)t(6)A37 methyltransferase TsaA|nr:tRNA (N6-threonylcarbamoyladenosine(37)-N6)-methyltransferase TrmO [Bryobacter sp.]